MYFFQYSVLYLINVSHRKFLRLAYITWITEFIFEHLTPKPTIVCEKQAK